MKYPLYAIALAALENTASDYTLVVLARRIKNIEAVTINSLGASESFLSRAVENALADTAESGKTDIGAAYNSFIAVAIADYGIERFYRSNDTAISLLGDFLTGLVGLEYDRSISLAP